MVKNCLLWVGGFAILALAGCEKKHPSIRKIFPQKDLPCVQKVIPNSFIVRWKNGNYTVEQGDTSEVFAAEFITPNYDQIDSVEHDQWVTLPENNFTQEFGDFAFDARASDAPNWAIERINVQEAWDQNVLGASMVVAIIDSGINRDHPLLKEKLYLNSNEIPENGIDDDGNGLVDDVSGWDFTEDQPQIADHLGHGTHVAGIIGATRDKKVAGVAPDAKLLPLVFLSADGGGRLSNAIKAIEYAQKMGATVINASWGGAACSPALEAVIQKAGEAGIIFVSAAGNSHQDIDKNPEYPSGFNLPLQINVGASDRQDLLAAFSNTGKIRVHLVAPGTDILSTYRSDSVASLSGTSMAAPFVSGTAALLLSSVPKPGNLSPNEIATLVKEAILSSTDQSDYPVATSGRLNVGTALKKLRSLVSGSQKH